MRIGLSVAAFVVSLAVPGLICAQTASGQKPATPAAKAGQARGGVPASAADEAAVRALPQQYQDAFNANNAAKAAGIFAENGVLVDETGKTMEGRAAIEKDLSGGEPAQRPRLSLTVEAVRFIKPDVALLRGSSTASGGNVPEGQGAGHWAAVAMKVGGEWKVVAAQAAVNPPATGRGGR